MNAQPSQAQIAAASTTCTRAPLSEVICWSRMQADAGEPLEVIVARKEAERRAGDGLFFWGVGNAPARAIAGLAQVQQRVDAIFSVMKSKPKLADTVPSELYVWRRFIDLNGIVRPLPSGSLVTSRGDIRGGVKRRHYALVCHSADPVVLGDFGSFYPSAYRNVGGTGAPIGASQVTALLKPCAVETAVSDYRINMRAVLTGSYWVKLADPVLIDGSKRALWERRMFSLPPADVATWRDFVSELREGDTATRVLTGHQGRLFPGI